MLRFRQMKSLQKFASVHASFHNHFNSERHLVDRQTFKERRSTALVEWQSLPPDDEGNGDQCVRWRPVRIGLTPPSSVPPASAALSKTMSDMHRHSPDCMSSHSQVS